MALGFSIEQRVHKGVATTPETPMIHPNVKALIKSTIFRFNTLAYAEAMVGRALYPMMIVLGDHDGERGEYWVVTPADATRLVRAGYEYAR